ncbi:hypothetical protein P5673_019557 [Acropora cervicornis]|uniref:Uncharacterized protein n=1 Tax=Acropora cervicornis TaxID=6130 RepID=A0AAD9V1M6_ACRCE|nr:hypothetical protein P5673_019557 [Acropora cervicornis]
MRWARDPPVLALQWLDNKVVSMTSTSANANDKVQPIRKAKVGGVWDPDRRVDQPQRPAKYNLREFRLELARNIIDLPKFGPSPPLYVNPSRELAPVGTFDVQHCPAFVDDRRDCVVCKKRDGVRRPVFSTCSAPQCEGKYQCHQGEELLSSVPHQAVSFPPVT